MLEEHTKRYCVSALRLRAECVAEPLMVMGYYRDYIQADIASRCRFTAALIVTPRTLYITVTMTARVAMPGARGWRDAARANATRQCFSLR